MMKEHRDVLPNDIKDACVRIIENKLDNIHSFTERKEFDDTITAVLLKDSGGPQEFLLCEKNSLTYTNVAEKISFEIIHQDVFSSRSEQVGDGERVFAHLRRNSIPCFIDGKHKGYADISLLSAPGDVRIDFSGSSRVDGSQPRDVARGAIILTPDTLRNAVAIVKTTVLDVHDKKGVYNYPSLRIATQQELRAILDGLRGIGR